MNLELPQWEGHRRKGARHVDDRLKLLDAFMSVTGFYSCAGAAKCALSPGDDG